MRTEYHAEKRREQGYVHEFEYDVVEERLVAK